MTTNNNKSRCRDYNFSSLWTLYMHFNFNILCVGLSNHWHNWLFHEHWYIIHTCSKYLLKIYANEILFIRMFFPICTAELYKYYLTESSCIFIIFIRISCTLYHGFDLPCLQPITLHNSFETSNGSLQVIVQQICWRKINKYLWKITLIWMNLWSTYF